MSHAGLTTDRAPPCPAGLPKGSGVFSSHSLSPPSSTGFYGTVALGNVCCSFRCHETEMLGMGVQGGPFRNDFKNPGSQEAGKMSMGGARILQGIWMGSSQRRGMQPRPSRPASPPPGNSSPLGIRPHVVPEKRPGRPEGNFAETKKRLGSWLIFAPVGASGSRGAREARARAACVGRGRGRGWPGTEKGQVRGGEGPVRGRARPAAGERALGSRARAPSSGNRVAAHRRCRGLPDTKAGGMWKQLGNRQRETESRGPG